jgi:predicted secreted acid phosphatase
MTFPNLIRKIQTQKRKLASCVAKSVQTSHDMMTIGKNNNQSIMTSLMHQNSCDTHGLPDVLPLK